MAEAPKTIKFFDLNDIVTPLTSTEEAELVRVLKNPVVIKYFKNVGYTAVLSQAFMTVEKLATNGNAYQLEQAFQKGILSVADLVLNLTPKS